MELIDKKISQDYLKKLAQKTFGDFVKAVVDLDKGIMIIDGELHADQEALLLEKGSQQKNLWGINLYPERGEDWIEFTSMINIRPASGNLSMTIDNKEIRQKIIQIVNQLVER